MSLSEIGGKRLPFLRWSAVRMILGYRHLTTKWQVGDGREEALAAYVVSHAREGDVDDAIRVIDEFCYHRSVMMNVGDEKGEILDGAVQRALPRRILELGTYCGYSALRIARVMPADAALYSVEFSQANADIARRIWEHADVASRLTVVVGSLGDGGATLACLEAEHGFKAGNLDFVFVDHDKAAYLPDLERILDRGWLRRGSVVPVAAQGSRSRITVPRPSVTTGFNRNLKTQAQRRRPIVQGLLQSRIWPRPSRRPLGEPPEPSSDAGVTTLPEEGFLRRARRGNTIAEWCGILAQERIETSACHGGHGHRARLRHHGSARDDPAHRPTADANERTVRPRPALGAPPRRPRRSDRDTAV
jgi:predicted O-methyltransferase YrrM